MRFCSESKMNSSKNSSTTILQIVLLIGVLAALIFVFRYVKTNLLPSADATTDSQAAGAIVANLAETNTPVVLADGWLLYSDPDGEFSFAYPPEAVISAGQNPLDGSKNITLQFVLPGKPYQGMSIRIEPNPESLKSADAARALYEETAQQPAPAGLVTSLGAFTVGGVPSVQAVIPATNTEITIITALKDKIVIFSPVHDSAATGVEQEVLALFYQIIETFIFGASK